MILIKFALSALIVLVANPGEGRLHDPFSADTETIYAGPLVDVWNHLREQIALDDLIVSYCGDELTADCEAARKLKAVVDDARQYQGKALLGHINRSINLMIWPAPGRLMSGLDVLKMGSGDCKDYAVAKYAALLHAGIAASRMRLIVVDDKIHHEDHMLVAAYDEGRWLLLDNLTLLLLEDRERAAVFVPLFVADDVGVRRYIPPI